MGVVGRSRTRVGGESQGLAPLGARLADTMKPSIFRKRPGPARGCGVAKLERNVGLQGISCCDAFSMQCSGNLAADRGAGVQVELRPGRLDGEPQMGQAPKGAKTICCACAAGSSS